MLPAAAAAARRAAADAALAATPRLGRRLNRTLPRSVRPVPEGAAAAAAAPGRDGLPAPSPPSPPDAAAAAAHKGFVRGASVAWADAAGVGGAGPPAARPPLAPPARPLTRRALLRWDEGRPTSALLVKKMGSPAAAARLADIAAWLSRRGLAVFAEPGVVREAGAPPGLRAFDGAAAAATAAGAPGGVDFVVALGGDGTVLRAASLFGEDAPLPPVVALAMGTLGFLTPFDAGAWEAVLRTVLAAGDAPVHCTLRTRLTCEVLVPPGAVRRESGGGGGGHGGGPTRAASAPAPDDGAGGGGPPAPPPAASPPSPAFPQPHPSGLLLTARHHVLNECLIDRGASPAMVCLEAYVDGGHVTTVQADGLIVATPSGSTAYSLSAGGPMVAPSVPATLLTPVAPHSLSFRPLVLPEACDLALHLPPTARGAARISFDGRHAARLPRGAWVLARAAACALPMVTGGPLDGDWYGGIVQKLRWNEPIRPGSGPPGGGGGGGGGGGPAGVGGAGSGLRPPPVRGGGGGGA